LRFAAGAQGGEASSAEASDIPEEFPDTESAIEECYGAGRTSVVAISLYQVVGELREIWADTSNKKT
jgi:hypothetical protein